MDNEMHLIWQSNDYHYHQDKSYVLIDYVNVVVWWVYSTNVVETAVQFSQCNMAFHNLATLMTKVQ